MSKKNPKISRGNLLKELEVPVGKAGGLVPQLHPLLHQLQGGGVVHTRQVRSRLHTLCIRMTIIVLMLITKIISFLSTVRWLENNKSTIKILQLPWSRGVHFGMEAIIPSHLQKILFPIHRFLICPKVIWTFVNFQEISRFLLNAIHSRAFLLDFPSPAINFLSPRSRP